jgi:hypothetical protein
MSIRKTAAFVGVVLLSLIGSSLSAQFGPQLGAMPPVGQPIAPYFEGWYANPDGTYTFSFGYHNFNTEEAVDIPVGPDNFIEPAEFDRGEQPTHFPMRPRRDRGLFTITVPAEYADERPVVWTLRRNGQTLSVPGRMGVSPYQLDHLPKPAGTLPPVLRFSPNGPDLIGLKGVLGDPDAPGADVPGTPKNPVSMSAKVGQPLELKVWVADRMAAETRDTTELHAIWHKHQGPPGLVVFGSDADDEEGEGDDSAPDSDSADDSDDAPEEPKAATGAALDGSMTETATFSVPGEYVLRVSLDSFGADDSSAGGQCCWTNAYVRVNVTE